MPAFSLFAILGVAALRLRLRNRCGLGLNRDPPFLDGHYLARVLRNKYQAVSQDDYWLEARRLERPEAKKKAERVLLQASQLPSFEHKTHLQTKAAQRRITA
jgi:hypothetical protein